MHFFVCFSMDVRVIGYINNQGQMLNVPIKFDTLNDHKKLK